MNLIRVITPLELFNAAVKDLKDSVLKAVDLFCDPNIPDYIQARCGTQTGGVPFFAIVDTSVALDRDDLSATLELESWWTSNINVSPSNRHVVLNSRGSKPKGTPNEEPGFGFLSVINNGVERTLTFETIEVVENERFWSAVNKKLSHQFIYGTTTKDDAGNYLAYLSANEASISADVVIDQDVKSRIRIAGDAKWTSDGSLDTAFSFPASLIATLSA
jgi:hypothetical protein